jgi:hypothetical protein
VTSGVWSPDGKRIAFRVGAHGKLSDEASFGRCTFQAGPLEPRRHVRPEGKSQQPLPSAAQHSAKVCNGSRPARRPVLRGAHLAAESKFQRGIMRQSPRMAASNLLQNPVPVPFLPVPTSSLKNRLHAALTVLRLIAGRTQIVDVCPR